MCCGSGKVVITEKKEQAVLQLISSESQRSVAGGSTHVNHSSLGRGGGGDLDLNIKVTRVRVEIRQCHLSDNLCSLVRRQLSEEDCNTSTPSTTSAPPQRPLCICADAVKPLLASNSSRHEELHTLVRTSCFHYRTRR